MSKDAVGFVSDDIALVVLVGRLGDQWQSWRHQLVDLKGSS